MNSQGDKLPQKKSYRIVLLPGDGVGPEIVEQGRKVLDAAARRFSFEVAFETGYIGLAAMEKFGRGFPDETLALCRAGDAVLMGAHGGATGWNAYKTIDPSAGGKRGLHNGLGLSVNFRPARLLPGLGGCSALKPSIVERGVDLVIVRELTSGLWQGRPRSLTKTATGRSAVNTLRYREAEVARALRAAFVLAGERRGKLTVVAQDNSLESSQLWRQVALEMAQEFPAVELQHHYPDAFGRLLLVAPGDFDVVIVDNMYIGGVFNDQCGAIIGSLGLVPSADLRIGKDGRPQKRCALYEPAHGSVPHRAGKNQVNPLATILAAALLLRYSLGQAQAARAVEDAVEKATLRGRTYDLAQPGSTVVGTAEMGDLVVEALSATSAAS